MTPLTRPMLESSVRWARLIFSPHLSAPSPTTPSTTLLTVHLTAPPATTKPKAVKYLHPSSILNASIFWTATAHATPRRTQSTPPPWVERKLDTDIALEPLKDGTVIEAGFLASDVSPYFQTTIKMGNKDMQELTNRAVEMVLGVGLFGGDESGFILILLELAFGLPSLPCSSFAVAPSFQTIASQRMVKC